MTLQRLQVEKHLVEKLAGRMELVGMSTTVSADSPNPALNGPICDALLDMGITPANIGEVVDRDLETVTELRELLDRARLSLLVHIRGNLNVSDLAVGPHRESFTALIRDISLDIEALETRISAEYGFGLGQLKGGVINLNFQQRADD